MVLEVTKGPTRVVIDPRRCIANAKCTAAAPGIYVLDEETGVAVIENASRGDRRAYAGRLDELASIAERPELTGPYFRRPRRTGRRAARRRGFRARSCG